MALAIAVALILVVVLVVGVAGMRSLRTFVRSLWPH